ncbi:response regulator [Streptomyces sp. NPDC001941]|uniref:response regulator n=1 Tax=Streptomyces sp. NPDC001941 TaxID=3154659 RepID=UPI00332204F6
MDTRDPGTRRIDRNLALIVEDSAEDTEAIGRALARSHPDLRLLFTTRAEQALEVLAGCADGALPGLVVLDLNMPGMDGHDALRAIRAQPGLERVRIVVFTSSTAPAEVDASYAAGADSYVYKPVNFDLFRAVLSEAVDYWLAGPETPEA